MSTYPNIITNYGIFIYLPRFFRGIPITLSCTDSNKEISETVKQTLTNGTEYEQKYEAIFNLIKVKAIVTLNDSVAAEFSLNSDIVFGGFELK